MMKTEFILGHSSAGFHKIAVHVWGKSEQGVPLVCVHGLGRTGRDFDRLAERMKQKRPIYALDMPGRGQSDNLAEAKDYTFSQYVSDLTALIARIDAPQVDYVGTSMGGLLGLILAAAYQTPIRRLVINDVGPVIPQAALDRIKSYLTIDMPSFATLGEFELFLRKTCASYGILSDADWGHMAEVTHRRTEDNKYTWPYDPKIMVAVCSDNDPVNLWSVYDNIRCPTLVLHGAKSDILTSEIAQEMTQRGPRASLVDIEGAGHAPALMNENETKLIEDFLNG